MLLVATVASGEAPTPPCEQDLPAMRAYVDGLRRQRDELELAILRMQQNIVSLEKQLAEAKKVEPKASEEKK
jgi:hypothetical protein